MQELRNSLRLQMVHMTWVYSISEEECPLLCIALIYGPTQLPFILSSCNSSDKWNCQMCFMVCLSSKCGLGIVYDVLMIPMCRV